MIQLIRSSEGLRVGNIIFVDSFVFPPNFICAQPQMLGEGFEQAIEKQKDIPNCAYLNLEDKWIEQLMDKSDAYKSGELTLSKIQDECYEKLPLYILKHKDQEVGISFVHELQNTYKDLIGQELEL